MCIATRSPHDPPQGGQYEYPTDHGDETPCHRWSMNRARKLQKCPHVRKNGTHEPLHEPKPAPFLGLDRQDAAAYELSSPVIAARNAGWMPNV